MTDFRMANIPKQEAYDLLRDWIKLVARHTNPDQNISELLGWLWKLKPPVLDSETGLVPCGCGGKAILFHQPDIEGPGSDGDRWAVFCEKTCGMETSDMTSPECAGETWNTGMGRKREGRGSREGSVV